MWCESVTWCDVKFSKDRVCHWICPEGRTSWFPCVVQPSSVCNPLSVRKLSAKLHFLGESNIDVQKLTGTMAIIRKGCSQRENLHTITWRALSSFIRTNPSTCAVSVNPSDQSVKLDLWYFIFFLIVFPLVIKFITIYSCNTFLRIISDSQVIDIDDDHVSSVK